MPARASRTGATHAHVTWLKPLEGTARLLTTLVVRDNVDIRDPSDFLVAELGLQGLNTAHVFGSSILFEVKPPTGEPDAGNPLVRFGGGRGRTQSVPPTPIYGNPAIETLSWNTDCVRSGPRTRGGLFLSMTMVRVLRPPWRALRGTMEAGPAGSGRVC